MATDKAQRHEQQRSCSPPSREKVASEGGATAVSATAAVFR